MTCSAALSSLSVTEPTASNSPPCEVTKHGKERIMNESITSAAIAFLICAVGIFAAVWSLRGDNERE